MDLGKGWFYDHFKNACFNLRAGNELGIDRHSLSFDTRLESRNPCRSRGDGSVPGGGSGGGGR